MERAREHTDQLLECLVFLSKFYAVPNSRDALISGLPLVDGCLTLPLFARAAERAGFVSRTYRSDITAVSPLLFPCVLLMKDGGACVLLSRDDERQECQIILPLLGGGEQTVALADLMAQYDGTCILLKKQFKYDARSPKVLETRRGHWFWSTLLESTGIYRDVLIASILINLFAIASPLFTMNVYDKIVPNLAFDSLWVLAIGVSIIFLFDFLMRQLRSYFIDIAGKKSDVLLSAKIFAKVMGIRMEARPASTGAFAKHLQEFEAIREFFTSATVAALIDLPFAFFFLLITGVNLCHVSLFGELEFWFASIKIFAIVSMILLGSFLLFSGHAGPDAAVSNLWAHGGFLPHGWEGVFTALAVVADAVANRLVGHGLRRPPAWNLDKYREARQAGWLCDNSRICAELGFVPRVNLEAGMTEAIEGYRREGWL